MPVALAWIVSCNSRKHRDHHLNAARLRGLDRAKRQNAILDMLAPQNCKIIQPEAGEESQVQHEPRLASLGVFGLELSDLLDCPRVEAIT